MASADSTANVCGRIKLTVIKTFESCANVFNVCHNYLTHSGTHLTITAFGQMNEMAVSVDPYQIAV